ncbi:MAG: histidine kinase [Actinomycetota bacterium]
MSLREEQLQRLRWWAGGVVVAGAAVTIALEIATPRLDEAAFSFLVLAFPAVGFFVLGRRPDARIAWLMLSMGVGLAIFGPLSAYGMFAIARGMPLGSEALALGSPGWVPFIAISGYILLLFPDGHLPSPRWRWFAWACGIGLALVIVWIWFYPGDFADSGYPDVANPFGVEALAPVLEVFGVLLLAAPLLIVGGFVGLVVRLRRTTDDVVRHQVRWITYVAALIAGLFAISFIPGVGNEAWDSVIQNLATLLFISIPFIVGIAILQYHLYDIDVVIRKTVVYVVLAVLLLGVGLALVAVAVATASVFSSSVNSGRLDLFIGIVIGALIWPLRRLAIRIADRIVFGRRASPYEVLTDFGDRLAGTYAADDVLPRTARVLGEGVGADRTRVWLSVGEGLVPVATWSRDGVDPDGPDDHRADVRHQGELLGALSVTMPPNDPMDPAKEKLVGDLAAQCGLLLRNVRLVEELRASRRRLVAAQDEERRKLERNIHDGAQQQLVALAVKSRLARGSTERDPAKTAELLTQIEQETQQALDDLRDLARGIYPPLLADKGLASAIEAQCRRSPLPVTVSADGIGRFPSDVEAAVYFSVLEALQNIAKYAHATEATVSLSHAGGQLTFEVSDDGRGFDLATTGHGTGLQGIDDRLGALDGTLHVESSVGVGTRLVGRLPGKHPFTADAATQEVPDRSPRDAVGEMAR